jgi:1-phosphofructokinase
MILTVTPNPSVDWTLEIQSLTRGVVHRASRQHQEPSGKGVNVARALTNNDIPSSAVLPIGGAEGAELSALLAEEGVDFVAVPIAGSVRVNVSLTEPDGTATKINAAGPTLSRTEVDHLIEAVVVAGMGASWVVGAGSLPQGVGVDFYASLAERVRGTGARFALDSSGPALVAGLVARPHLIKPNVDELSEAVGRPILTLGDVVAAGQDLIRRGAATVVVSLGADGALLVTDTEMAHAEAHVSAPRSTVGAGDALLAGCLAGGGAGVAALREAVAWGSAAVQVEGSHVPKVTRTYRDAVHVHDAVDVNRTLRQGTRTPPGWTNDAEGA